MRVVVALGGNALLRRGQALTDENQRRNVAAACESLAPIALAHELVVGVEAVIDKDRASALLAVGVNAHVLEAGTVVTTEAPGIEFH